MSKLTKEQRDALPDSAFALPGRRFPIHDASHARDALSRASESLNKGDISKEEYRTIVRKAKEILAHDHKGTESYGSLWNRHFQTTI